MLPELLNLERGRGGKLFDSNFNVVSGYHGADTRRRACKKQVALL
jgi:hypothetical protein